MATTKEFIEYVCEQMQEWKPEYKKMFGEYMVYIQAKPVFLVCDNTVYVKELPVFDAILKDAEKGNPYEGAKEHYIVDIDDTAIVHALIPVLVENITVPVKKIRRTQKSHD